MKKDIDQLLESRNLDGLLIVGPGQHNPAMYYFTGGGHLTSAILVKKRGSEPLLVHYSMERDEAAKTGLPTRDMADYSYDDYLKQANGDYLQAIARVHRQIFSDVGIDSGRVGVYGKQDAGITQAIFTALQSLMPDLTLVGEYNDTVLLQAMSTKDTEEIERIRAMGLATTAVVGQVADFLTSHRVKDGILIKPDGTPLTIGEVKRRIDLWLVERGVENPEGTIFAIGRDAGIPHSTGNPSDYLSLGKTIVFDIYPCETGGGYFYDLTRTWCLGYAPDDALSLYEDVLAVYQDSMRELEVDALCKDFQKRACDLFEGRGHPTIQSNPQTQVGYVHSLGHGVGLNIHEKPSFNKYALESDRLTPGVVITVEPGLYYPERGLGVRLEDTVCVGHDGQIGVLAEFPLDLVLPMKEG